MQAVRGAEGHDVLDLGQRDGDHGVVGVGVCLAQRERRRDGGSQVVVCQMRLGACVEFCIGEVGVRVP